VKEMDEPTDGEGKGEESREECEPGDIEYVDEDMARALAHPMRIRILAALSKRVMSPSGFAKRFDEKLQNVSYHFRVLQRYDLIEEVEIRPVRGAVEHFYRAIKRVLFDGKAWDGLPPSLKKKVSAQTFEDFLEAVAAAMVAETFDSFDERMAVWLQKPLDEQGWREAVAAERELVRKMEAIFKESGTRLAEAGEPEGGILGTYGLFLFESPSQPDPEGDEEE
jgi:DNA-binding transcriptional ArsR family regulator